MPPMAVARPSARSTLPMSDGLDPLSDDLAGGQCAAGGFHGGDQQHDDHRRCSATMSNLGMPNRKGWVKPNAEAGADPVEVHVAQRESHRAARSTTPSSTAMVDDEPAEDALDRDDDRRWCPPRSSTQRRLDGVGLAGVRVGHRVVGADGHQTQADDGDERAGDHGREEPAAASRRSGAIRNVKTPATITAP